MIGGILALGVAALMVYGAFLVHPAFGLFIVGMIIVSILTKE